MHKTESQPFHSKSFLSSWMSLSLSLLWWQTCFTKSVSFSYLSQNMRLIWENMCNPLLSTFCGLFSLMNYHSFLFVWIVLHFSYFSRSLFIAPNIKLGRGVREYKKSDFSLSVKSLCIHFNSFKECMKPNLKLCRL